MPVLQMNPLIIELDGASPSLNTLMGLKRHPKTRGWKYKSYKSGVMAAIRLRLPLGFVEALHEGGPYKIDVRFERHSSGELDDDNLPGGFKPMRYALKDLKVIVDDNSEWLKASYAQVKCKMKEGKTVLV